ncbi:MAG TPA: hypothetical protein VF199_03815 [Bacillales bacterium]
MYRESPEFNANMLAFGIAVWIIFIVIYLGVYILQATAFFKMFKKADVEPAWLAYIPIAQVWPFFWTIKKSAWNILWFFLPVAGGIVGGILLAAMQDNGGLAIFITIIVLSSIVPMILEIIWTARLFKAFALNPAWVLLVIGCFIPFINFLTTIGLIVIFCYMGFSKEVQYHPDFE